MEEVEKYLRKIKKPTTMEKILEKISSLGEYNLDDVKKIIDEKIKNYEIIETSKGKFVPIFRTSFRVGKYHAYKDGNGVVVNLENKYPILEEYASKVIDGDLVLIDTYIPAGTKNKSCRIEKILSRDVSDIVGEVAKIDNNYFVIPEDAGKRNLTILLEGNDYIEGEKVIVDCADKRSDNFYVGTITKSIGHRDDPGVDIVMEAYKYGIDNEISDEELSEIDAIPTHVLDSDRIGRMDLTEKEIFTIDGKDSKDLDDAVSLEILDNGNYLLGVHIADVSHYIKEGSLIDKRAQRKTTSSYLANTVIPMLHHKISNGICSLNPKVDRLAVSCFMEFDKNGERVNYNIGLSVINSNIKMNHDSVNNILERDIIEKEYEPHVNTLKNMEILSKKLYGNRLKRGAVDLDKPELKLIMDDNCQVVDFEKRYQNTGESIIEEFMLVTNETLALHMYENDYLFIYRNHEEPREAKLIEYLDMLKNLGYQQKFNIDDERLGQKLANFISQDEALADTLKIKLLRSFRRAFYGSENLGHYGLASDCYCHFTSPIRRYPDTINHRLVKDFMFSDKDKEKLKKKWKKQLEEIAKHCSVRERAADDCERAVLLMKCAEYMENHIGDEFQGTIVDMYNDGLQIELDNMIEGRVRLKDLKGKYVFNPETLSYISLNGRDDYYLGDRLDLKVSSASKEKKEIDFEIVGKISENTRINQNVNDKVRVLEKKKRADEYYYNVNKGIKR